MIKNSIKEDIKILEKKIEDYEPYKNIEYCSHAGQILQEEHKALEHILSDYKRVLERNEVLLKEIKQLRTEVNSLKKENKQFKNDIENMYDEEVVISIMCDEFNLSRNEALKVLRGE